MHVRDWMSPDPTTLNPDASVREARQLMGYYGCRHIPVIANDRLVGIVSDRDVRIDDDILRRAVENSRTKLDERLSQVMSSPPHTIDPDASVEAAARIMLSWRVSALPVVEDNRCVGIITTTDCLLAALSIPSECWGAKERVEHMLEVSIESPRRSAAR